MLVVAGGPAEPTELLSTTHDTGPCRPPARPSGWREFFLSPISVRSSRLSPAVILIDSF